MALLTVRQADDDSCTDSFGNVVSCNVSPTLLNHKATISLTDLQNAWYDWGRWVALGIIIIGFILLFFLFSCISSRRRRRRGAQPYYGTGWVGRTPFGHGQAQYNPQYGQQQQPYGGQQQQPYGGYQQGQQGGYYGQQQQAPPTYNQSYDANRGYYGQPATPSTGVYEMQPPSRTYQSTAPEVSGAKK